jgi:folate-dependent phosphoribosylglycinamide formyltransferase PurN
VRTLLLTADGARHRYAARSLAATTDLVGVLSEGKAESPSADPMLAPGDAAVLQRHFAERDAAESALLGPDTGFPATEVRRVPRHGVNTPETLAWIRSRDPEVVVLFGTSLVREPLLGSYAGRMVNLHLGLSPYYRGAATNFWPLVLEQPECVGATLHLVVAQVDAGGILAQVRPAVSSTDRAHEVGTKALIAALERLPGTLTGLLAGTIRPVAQDLSQGREFRRRDFRPDAIRRLWRNLDQGMLAAYLPRARERCAAFPIVEAGR